MKPLKTSRLLIFVTFISGCGEIGSNSLFGSCPPLIEPVSDTKVAEALKEIEKQPGAYWTKKKSKKFDCRYINTPKEQTLVTSPSRNCEDAKHNLKLYESGCPYYSPLNAVGDGIIWCLVDVPKKNTDVAKDDVYLRCGKDDKANN